MSFKRLQNSSLLSLAHFNTVNTSNMTNMLRDAVSYDKGVRCWNVPLILSVPTGFNNGSAMPNPKRPIWGTDGSGGVCD